MASGRHIWLLLAYFTFISGSTCQIRDGSRGRKLFGGYRIVPKSCQPSLKGKSNEPAVCMFNYECNRRNGKVVGACMDGFLFGACCQLPANTHSAVNPALPLIAGLNHMPEASISPSSRPENWEEGHPDNQEIDDLSLPTLLDHTNTKNDLEDSQEEKQAEEIKPIETLQDPNQVLQISDPVDQLTGLFSHAMGPSNHSITETVLIDKNGSLIDEQESPDLLFKPANRSTTSYFSSSESSTVKMEPVNTSTHHRDSTTVSGLVKVPTINHETQLSGNKKHDDEYNREEIAINHIISILNGSTPNAAGESPPRTTTQQVQSSEGTPIHSWVTIEDTPIPSSSTEKFPYTFYKPATRPSSFYYYETPASGSLHLNRTPSYTSSNSYPTTYGSSSSNYPYSTKPTANPPAPTVIVLGPFGTSEYSPITSPKPLGSKRPISSSIRPSLVTKKPSAGTTITHNINTVISTDNVASASASNIISTSYINVKLKDTSTTARPSSIKDEAIVTNRPSTIWTTLSTWSSKPSFQLKPDQPDFDWPADDLTQVHTHTVVFKPTDKPSTLSAASPCDDDTSTSDDLNNFPPDRNPNLTNSTPTSQQERPTVVDHSGNIGYPEIASENDVPTPTFIEDDVLSNKVDDFVHKIVDSLQGNFQDLKDVVYTKKNVTQSTTASSVTKPVTTRKPSVKPGATRRPTTKKPSTSRPAGGSSSKPVKTTRPTKSPNTSASATAGTTTKKPSATTKRPKPVRRNTTSSTTETISTTLHFNVQEAVDEATQAPDFHRECGVRPLIKKGRVVGGKKADFGEWPWQVLVREATWLGLFTKNKCGGVLITQKYVITAAHCQPGFLASLVAVFGEFDISSEIESRRSVTKNVARVIPHRQYNPNTFENDLAILELESPIQFDAHIVPICMPDDDDDFTGKMATVTGWGRVKYNGGVPAVLQEVQVPVMENSVCQEMFRTADKQKLILDSFLCAGYANGQKDSCEGDSGGPLMIEKPNGRWVLVGTVSHGIQCAAPYLPGVYMRTTYFKPWLHSITGV